MWRSNTIVSQCDDFESEKSNVTLLINVTECLNLGILLSWSQTVFFSIFDNLKVQRYVNTIVTLGGSGPVLRIWSTVNRCTRRPSILAKCPDAFLNGLVWQKRVERSSRHNRKSVQLTVIDLKWSIPSLIIIFALETTEIYKISDFSLIKPAGFLMS